MLNPFLDSRVKHAWEDPVAQLPGVHDEALDRTWRYVESVRNQKVSFGLVIHGVAGSGKTHLLSLLRRKAAESNNTVFAFARLDTSSSRLWRHVRSQLIHSLEKSGWLDRLLASNRDAIASIRSRKLRIVLDALASGQHRFDCLDWLRGDSLDEATLNRIGIVPTLEDDAEEQAEADSRALVFSLAAWIAPLPLVYCFDQVEAIQSHPGDTDSLFRLGQACASLLDQSSNILLVSCLQTSFLDELQQSVRGADQDRFLREKIGLAPIHLQQAEALVQLRLAGLEGVTRSWPVDLNQLPAALPFGTEVIRKVLFAAARLFDEGCGRPRPAPLPPDTFVARAYETELDQATAHYNSTFADHVLSDGLPLLLYQDGWRSGKVPGGIPQPCLALDKSSQRRYVILLNENNSNRIGNKVRRLLIKDGSLSSVTLARDASLGISPAARVTRQRLEDFQSRGGKFVQVSREALLALEAMRKLLSKAEAGDLSHEGETLAESFVDQWLRDHRPAPLASLLEELTGEASPAPDALAILSAYLADNIITTVEAVAGATQLTPEQVEDCARHHPDQLVFFGGETPILCRGAGA